MDSVMNGLQGVGGILDDLIITGSNDETHFRNLDLSSTYQQVLLDEESRKYVTINMHLGLS